MIYGADLATFLCFINPFCYLDAVDSYNDAVLNSNSWKEGYDWFANANATWKAIIGADEYVESEVWTCQCIDEHEFDLVDDYYTIEPGEECDPGWGDCIVHINYNINFKESDGVVLAESAANCPGMTAVYEMPGSNHFSMRNDFNTELGLAALFNGELGPFFLLSER